MILLHKLCNYFFCHCAVSDKANLRIVQSILAKGAKVNARTSDKTKPLHIAVSNGEIEIVYLLSESRASLNLKGYLDLIPLHRTVESDELLPVVELLLSSGANIEAKTTNGTYSASPGCRNKSSKILSFLINMGCKSS
ncbi:MAG: ankyrin repeat domain-containing protein [Candidatus Riflebacteria bacterium]|nr:ankyrin repeat domain-containing protein [Candidatus Riflebacteria bacterium]